MNAGSRVILLGLAAALVAAWALFPTGRTDRARADIESMEPRQLIGAVEAAPRSQRPRILDALAKQRGESIDALHAAAVGGTREEKLFAVRALAEMRDAGALDVLLAASSDADERVRKHAVIGLRKLGDRRAAPRVRELVTADRDRVLLKVALVALGRLGEPADVERIRPFLEHEDETVRVMAAAALGLLGDGGGLDVLLAAIDGDNPAAQKNATFALGYLDRPEARARLHRVLEQPTGRWKSYAAMALGEHEIAGRPAAEQAAALGRMARGEDRLVADWCLEKLTDLNTPEAVAEIAKLVHHGNRTGAKAQQRLALIEGRS